MIRARALPLWMSGWLVVLCGCQTPSQAAEAPAAAALPPPSASTAASASTGASAPAAASAECGARGQPDCPLQHWMKSTVQPYLREKDFGRLTKALEKIAANAPQGYARWADIAREGAAAAEKQDATAVTKSCKGCHNEHRTRFRKERRSEPLF